MTTAWPPKGSAGLAAPVTGLGPKASPKFIPSPLPQPRPQRHLFSRLRLKHSAPQLPTIQWRQGQTQRYGAIPEEAQVQAWLWRPHVPSLPHKQDSPFPRRHLQMLSLSTVCPTDLGLTSASPVRPSGGLAPHQGIIYACVLQWRMSAAALTRGGLATRLLVPLRLKWKPPVGGPLDP